MRATIEQIAGLLALAMQQRNNYSFKAKQVPTTATISSKYSLTMTTVVYILLHLDSVLNELFSRLFIFFFLLLLPVINESMTSSQTFKFISQNNVLSLIPLLH
jgi:hypothetical protein